MIHSKMVTLLLLILILSLTAPASMGKNLEKCPDGEIFLRRQVLRPGCYPKGNSSFFPHFSTNLLFLFSPVPIYHFCYSNAQCIPTHSFCGFQNDSSWHHQCLCKDGFEPVSNGSLCRPMTVCSVAHFNQEYLQADCPTDKEFCRESRCLCKAPYRRDPLTWRCLWNVPDQDEPGDISLWNQYSLYLDAHPALFWFLLIAIIIVIPFVCCGFCYLLPSYLLNGIPDKSHPSARIQSKTPGRTFSRQLSRQHSDSTYTLVSDYRKNN